MKIIYHSRDLDGFTSGAILKMRHPQAELIGYDYGQPVPEIPNGEDVIMVDVSFKPDVMMEIINRVKSFVWIDHHISAINEFKALSIQPHNLTTVLRDGRAACELAWEYAFPQRPVPIAVILLGMYDTWRNTDLALWDNSILPFQYGMRTICNSPETFPQAMFDYIELFELSKVMGIGKTILDYQQEQDKFRAKNAFEFDWKGYKVVAINGGGFNSNAFKSVYNPERHDLMMPFVFNGVFWVISLYTEKDIDCSEIAGSMGGGGHKKAAGFQVMDMKDLPFQHKLNFLL